MAKKLIAVSLMALLFAVLLTGCSQSEEDLSAKIVASMNDREITQQDFERYVKLNVSLYRNQSLASFSTEDQLRFLDQFINIELFYEEAIKQGIEVNEEEFDKEYEGIRKSMISHYFSNTEGMFTNRLQALDLTEDDVKEVIKKSMVIDLFVEQLAESIEPATQQDVQEFYDENPDIFSYTEQRQMRHILVDTAAEANYVLELLEEGADFGDLALRYSTDMISGTRGGVLDFASVTEYVEEFSAVAFNLEIGEVSGPVFTEFGYHIIEVLEIKQPGIYELTENLSNQITLRLKSIREEQIILDLLEQLKNDKNLEVKLG